MDTHQRKERFDEIRSYSLSLIGVVEDMPFDDKTLVFKVGGKIFLLTSLEGDLKINLKCEPELAVQLRSEYEAVIPGYHMNKKHWNTIHVNGSISDQVLYKWIDHSYELVANSLPLKVRSKLADQH